MKFSSPPGTRLPHVVRGRAPSVRLSNRPGNSHERRATCPLSRFSKGQFAGDGALPAHNRAPPRRNFSPDSILSRRPETHLIYHFQHQEARKKRDIMSVLCRGGGTCPDLIGTPPCGEVNAPAGADPCSLGSAIPPSGDRRRYKATVCASRRRIQPGWSQKRLDISYCHSRITN
jgi:hypothetical protein